MSLSTQELDQIRTVVVDGINEAFETVVIPRLDTLELQLERLEQRMGVLEQHMSALEQRVGRIELSLNQLEQSIHSIDGRLEALENDVRELYMIVKKHNHPFVESKQFSHLPNKQKIVVLDQAVTALADHLGVSLPR